MSVQDTIIFEKEYTEAIPYSVNIKCPKCNNGNLVFEPKEDTVKVENGEVYYIHLCDNKECGNFEKIKGQAYPKIEYRIKENVINKCCHEPNNSYESMSKLSYIRDKLKKIQFRYFVK